MQQSKNVAKNTKPVRYHSEREEKCRKADEAGRHRQEVLKNERTRKYSQI